MRTDATISARSGCASRPAPRSYPGDADDLIPLDHSRAFVERLAGAGIDARLEVLSGAGHGFGYNLVSEAAQRGMELAIPYLRERLATS